MSLEISAAASDLILERGRVIGIDGDEVVVASESRAACPRCASGRGCGGGIVARMLGDRLYSITASKGTHQISVGDAVTIGVTGRTLVGAALLVYLAPILSLLAGAVGAEALVGGDLAATLGAISGFVLGLWLARLSGARWHQSGMARPIIVTRHSHRLTGQTAASQCHQNWRSLS